MGMFKKLVGSLPIVITKEKLVKLLEDSKTAAVIEERRYKQLHEVGILNPFDLESDLGFIREWAEKDRSFKKTSIVGVKEAVTEESMFLSGTSSGESVSRSWTEAELRLAQDASFNAYNKWSHAASQVNAHVSYVLGRGMRFDTPDKKVTNLLMEKFWRVPGERISMERRQKELFRMKYIDGELFIILYYNKDGEVKVRLVPVDEIEQIIVDREDIEHIYGYKRILVDGKSKKQESIYYKDMFGVYKEDWSLSDASDKITESDFEENMAMNFTKFGNSFELRGRPPMYCNLMYHRLLRELIKIRATTQYEHSRIYLVKTIKGGKRSDEETTRVRRPPKGGYMLLESDSVTYRLLQLQGGAADAREDLNLVKYALAAGGGTPFFILDQNPENQNYASILEAGTPFVVHIIDMQDDESEDYKNLFRFVLQHNVHVSNLPESLRIETYDEQKVVEALQRILVLFEEEAPIATMKTEVKNTLGEKVSKVVNTIDIPISTVFPEVIRTDQVGLATVMKVYWEMGIASNQTIAEKAGFDFKLEAYRIALQKEKARNEKMDNIDAFKKDLIPAPPLEDENK